MSPLARSCRIRGKSHDPWLMFAHAAQLSSSVGCTPRLAHDSRTGPFRRGLQHAS